MLLINRLDERNKRTVYVIGQPGLEDELDERGIPYKGGSDPEDTMLMPYQVSFGAKYVTKQLLMAWWTGFLFHQT